MTAREVVVALVEVELIDDSPPAKVVEAVQRFAWPRLKSTFTFPVGEETVMVLPELAIDDTQLVDCPRSPDASPPQAFPDKEVS